MVNGGNLRRKSLVALLSVVSNTTLVALKLIVGTLVGSVSVISEAIHSGVDLLASAVAFVAVRTSGKPADEEHPFGHGKFENISGAFEAVLIFVAAAWIIQEAVHKIITPQPLEMVGWGVGIMFISTAVNIVVSRLLMKVGTETDSIALRADAWHLRTDIYTSAGVMVGLAIIWVAKLIFPKVELLWLDPIVAIGVALLIMKAAWELTAECLPGLLDVRLSGEDESWIRSYVSRLRPVVRGIHNLRTRKAGSARFIEFHLTVDPMMTVAASHRITEDIDSAISEKFPECYVNIHIEPCDGARKRSCMKGCLLSEEERRQHHLQQDVPLSTAKTSP